MLKKFKMGILDEVLNFLADENYIDEKIKWQHKGSESFLRLFNDDCLDLSIYLGIRFINDRDYVIPYLRIMDKMLKIPSDEFYLYDFQVTINELDKLIQIKNFSLNRADFGDYTNISAEINPPSHELIEGIRSEKFDEEKLNSFGVTKETLSSQNIRTWDIFTMFFPTTYINENEVIKCIKPVVDDVNKVYSGYFISFSKDFINLKKNL